MSEGILLSEATEEQIEKFTIKFRLELARRWSAQKRTSKSYSHYLG